VTHTTVSCTHESDVQYCHSRYLPSAVVKAIAGTHTGAMVCSFCRAVAGAISFMTKFMLGTKGRMTQVFDESGTVHAATVVNAGSLSVTQIKTVEKDGYAAVQVGYGAQKESRVNKPQRAQPFKHYREYVSDTALESGATIDVSLFAPGDVVSVSALSKGKGFQGVVKRHGFHGGPRSHGQKNKERAPGSIGGGGRAGGRVIKGMRMAGRMGGERVTVKNLKILQVDPATHTLVISGAVPGRPGTLVEIKGNEK